MRKTKKLISVLCFSALITCTGTATACGQEEPAQNTFDPVGTYTFYSLNDGENTYTAGQTVTINNVKQSLFEEWFVFTFQADGTAEYFTFGEEEILYGTWLESENDCLVSMTVNGETVQAKGENEFLTFTDENVTYTLQKTQPFPDTYTAYYGVYSFFSLTVDGVEYLEGETYLDFKTFSKDDYHYRIMPNGFLYVQNGDETYVARWNAKNEKLSFLLPYDNGTKSFSASIDDLGTLKLTTERKGNENTVHKEYWEFQQA